MVALASVFGTAPQADELQLGARASADYDTAALIVEGRRKNAWETNLGPNVRVRRERGALQYDVRYLGQFEYLYDSGGRSTWDHFLTARGSWQPDARTRVAFSNDFDRIEGPTFLRLTDEGVAQQTDADQADLRVDRNVANLDFSRSVAPDLQVNLGLSHSLAEFEDERRFDNQVTGVNAFLGWQARPRLGLQLGGGTSYQTVQGSLGQPGSRTLIHRIFGGGSFQLTRTLSLQLRAGPSLIQSSPSPGGGGAANGPRFPFGGRAPSPEVVEIGLVDIATCEEVDGRFLLTTCSGAEPDLLFFDTDGMLIGQVEAGGDVTKSPLIDFQEVTAVSLESEGQEDASSLQAFAEASLDWNDRYWSGRLRYRRSEQPSSISGGGTTVDSLTGYLSWRPTRLWNLVLSASWDRRRSTTEQVVLGPLIVVDSGLDGRRTPTGPDRSIAESFQRSVVETDNAIDQTTWAVVGRVTRSLSEHVSVGMELRYSEQDETGEVRVQGLTRRFVGRLTFSWDLDPLQF